MPRFIVMTSSAKMPMSCKGRYGNVAVVELTEEYAAANKVPLLISERARGVARIVWHSGPCNIGSTDRCAFARAMIDAKHDAEKLNAASS